MIVAMSAYSRSSRFCFLLLVPILALALSCSKADQPKTDAISITSGNNISFPAGVSSQTVYFNASGSWTATISDDDASSWLSIYPDHGNNDGSIIVAATENKDTKDRRAIVRIACGTASESISVLQKGCSPSVSKGYAELPVPDKSNSDYYYGTLYANTVISGKKVRNYSFCYDTRRHNPIWVAFPMHAIYAEGSGRSKNELGNDPWMQYPGLPVEEQSIIWDIGGDGFMYWSMTSSILSGGSWTKGHLCMSSSRAGAGSELNLQTFYPVNIAPQSNQYAGAGIFGSLWGETENLHWQRGTQICQDTLYVVAGCHYADDSNIEYDACNWDSHSSYSKQCVMPTHQYKLFLRTRTGNSGKSVQECSANELKAIGFWFDSVLPAGASENLSDYAVSIAEIEKKTGITFFPDIPAEVKQQYSTSFWGI